jgi:hypothetical protein
MAIAGLGIGNDGLPLEEPHDHAARVIAPGPLRYPPPMDRYLGLHIKKLCQNAIVHPSSGANHCAHFVCHIMRWDHLPGAARCDYLALTDSHPGVHIRVNEVFNVAPNRAAWAAGALLPDPCLAIATISSNVRPNTTIGDNAHKHIGIHYQSKIWHYSNAHSQVLADTPSLWRQRMTGAYGAQTVFFRSDFVHT